MPQSPNLPSPTHWLSVTQGVCPALSIGYQQKTGASCSLRLTWSVVCPSRWAWLCNPDRSVSLHSLTLSGLDVFLARAHRLGESPSNSGLFFCVPHPVFSEIFSPCCDHFWLTLYASSDLTLRLSSIAWFITSIWGCTRHSIFFSHLISSCGRMTLLPVRWELWIFSTAMHVLLSNPCAPISVFCWCRVWCVKEIHLS